MRAIGAISTQAVRDGNAEHPPLVYFHPALFEAGDAHEFIHLRSRPTPHDPGLALAISKNARNELHLRMPWLVGIHEVTARLDRVGQPAQRIEDRGVSREQFEQAGDDSDGRSRLKGSERRA